MKKAAKKSTGRGATAKKAKKKATAARSKAKATASGKKKAGTRKKTSATRAKKSTQPATRSKSSRKAPDVTTQALAVAQETIQHFDAGSLNRVRIGLAKLIRILSGEDDQS